MNFLFRLFFTKDDDLDLTQIVFLLWVGFVAFSVWQVGFGYWTLPTAAWSVIGSVFATLAITGTPKWVAELLAKRPPEGQMNYAQRYEQWSIEPVTGRVDDPDDA